MSKKDTEKQPMEESLHEQETAQQEPVQDVDNQAETSAEAEPVAEPTAEEKLQAEVAELRDRVAALEDKNLRLVAEFDNYRRRTNKEKLDLMETAGEKIFTEMLSLVDDFERAQKAMASAEDVQALREGMELIYQKFIKFLEKHDVHEIETADADFNTDEHEAITTFDAGEEKKNKVVDCTQKGYKLGDKVIRFAKVVVGA